MPLTLSGSNGVSGVDGSASTPALQGSDSNTGIHFPAADTVAIDTGGSERLRVNSSGNLGIGTTNPARKLSVATAGTCNVRISDSTNGVDLEAIADSTGGAIGTVTNHTLRFLTNDTERGRFDTSGRLLVGTSSSDWTRPRVVIVGNPNETTTGAGVLYLQKANGTVSAGDKIGEIAFSTSSSNVGVYAEIICEGDATGGSSDFPGRLVFKTCADGGSSTTERVRISNNGYFKATSDATYRNSTGTNHEFINSADSEVLWLRNKNASPYGVTLEYTAAAPNNTGNTFFYCSDTAAQRFAVRSNGGIANFSGNNVNLSDINTKKDIALAAGTWDCLKEWEIVNFRYKEQPDDADLNMGVIAQQVAESCPEVITIFQEAKEATEDQPAQEERLGVKEQQMMWMAIKALQEAQLRIESLETRLNALEGN